MIYGKFFQSLLVIISSKTSSMGFERMDLFVKESYVWLGECVETALILFLSSS